MEAPAPAAAAPAPAPAAPAAGGATEEAAAQAQAQGKLSRKIEQVEATVDSRSSTCEPPLPPPPLERDAPHSHHTTPHAREQHAGEEEGRVEDEEEKEEGQEEEVYMYIYTHTHTHTHVCMYV